MSVIVFQNLDDLTEFARGDYAARMLLAQANSKKNKKQFLRDAAVAFSPANKAARQELARRIKQMRKSNTGYIRPPYKRDNTMIAEAQRLDRKSQKRINRNLSYNELLRSPIYRQNAGAARSDYNRVVREARFPRDESVRWWA